MNEIVNEYMSSLFYGKDEGWRMDEDVWMGQWLADGLEHGREIKMYWVGQWFAAAWEDGRIEDLVID